MKKSIYYISIFSFILFLLSFLNLAYAFNSSNCIDIKIMPVKSKITLTNDSNENYVEFNVLVKNNCNYDFKSLSINYPGYIYYVISAPSSFSLKSGESKVINLKVYAPNYVSSGWKGIKLDIVDNLNNQVLKSFFLIFHLNNPHYKLIKEIKYVYLNGTRNLDLLINIPAVDKASCQKNHKKNFTIEIRNLNLKDIQNLPEDIDIIVVAKDTQGNSLPLQWNYLKKDELKKYLVKETKDGFILKNYLIDDFSINPGAYTVEAILTLKSKNNFELSEEAKNNIFIEGSPCFKVDEELDKGLLSSKKIITITNYGNKEGVYELIIPVNWFKKLFLEYNFNASFENGKLKTNIKLKPQESKSFVLVYDYSSVIILILVLSIAGGIYYYLHYVKPFSFKKDVIKVHLGKKKSFYIETIIRNNSLKTMKDIVIIERINNGTIDELSIYPKPDRVKKDLTSSSIRWEIKELKPQQKIRLTFKVQTDKNKTTIISEPTYLRVNNKIFVGKGLKIQIGDSVKFEEF
ncbi:MAG: hypothetical protein ABGW69_00290 [Nanoarchaeota archaeon]